MTLLVMVPTRGRRQQCERLLKSFTETTDNADILFVMDEDDEAYADMDWGNALHAISSPRGTLTQVLNNAATTWMDVYDVLMFVADDHVFRTAHWDTIMLNALKDLGGSGMIYPDDKRRADVPEIIMISSDIVQELGYFAEPSLKHFYLDNAWAELGKRTGLLRWCPEVVIEHMHYSLHPDVERDKTYAEAEDAFGQQDLQTFQQWRTGAQVAMAVSRLRRKFNPDVSWVLGKV